MTKLLLFLLPLSLDTFAVAAALGLAGLPPRQRLKISLLMSGFELSMPIVGVLIGRGLGSTVGTTANYIAVTILLSLGVYMFLRGDDLDEGSVSALVENRGLALLGVGLSISLDELAMGFTIGLLHLPLPIAVLLIGAQAFLVAQLGLRLGSRISAAICARAERLAGVALIALAGLVLAEELIT